jgi:hypothetical protein
MHKTHGRFLKLAGVTKFGAVRAKFVDRCLHIVDAEEYAAPQPKKSRPSRHRMPRR